MERESVTVMEMGMGTGVEKVSAMKWATGMVTASR
jgi:hypothetical protein